ncbi:MAG TPA: hypothetical protein VGO56_22615 [Pyrinomonadaceae bacterium]|jgi:hypothetical protein|nr:hypothetical protein [Pyrinomonadaceae bacterium]
MRRQQITLLLSGLIAGLISVSLGTLSLEFLAYGVGPLFFVAVVVGILITGSWRYVRSSFWRYLAGLLLTTLTYVAALVAFSAVAGFSDWLGFRGSAHLEDFRIDIWLGLIAAGVVGASGIAAFTALLTRKWSTSLLLRLMLAGLVTLVLTFIANLPFHSYWSFFGVLLPAGNALFCWLVGLQIWRNAIAARRLAPTTPS